MPAGSLGSVLVDWNGPGIGLGLVWDRFEVTPGSVWEPRGLGLGSVWVQFGICPWLVWGRSGIGLVLYYFLVLPRNTPLWMTWMPSWSGTFVFKSIIPIQIPLNDIAAHSHDGLRAEFPYEQLIGKLCRELIILAFCACWPGPPSHMLAQQPGRQW